MIKKRQFIRLGCLEPVRCRDGKMGAMKSWGKIAGGLLVGVLVLGAESARSQSLGDLARQERARRAAEPFPATRVYTNEDLQRYTIVDQQEPATIKDSLPHAAVSRAEDILDAPKISGAVPWSVGTPLGDIARYYRAKKQLLLEQSVVIEAKETGKPSQPPSSNSGAPSVAVSANLLGSKRQNKGKPADPPNSVPLPSGDWIRVASGDSLWKLAQAQFGNGEAWGCIVAVNPLIDDANRIYPGQLLTVPARCSSQI